VPQEVEPWNMAGTVSCADPKARFPCSNNKGSAALYILLFISFTLITSLYAVQFTRFIARITNFHILLCSNIGAILQSSGCY
jgi:hypothetical protein